MKLSIHLVLLFVTLNVFAEKKFDDYSRILNINKTSGCGQITDQSISDLIKMAENGFLRLDSFENAYRASCDYPTSLDVSENKTLATVFVGILEKDKSSLCPYKISAISARDLSQRYITGRLSLEGFYLAYNRCNYKDAYVAADSLASANAYRTVVDKKEELLELNKTLKLLSPLTEASAGEMAIRIVLNESNGDSFKNCMLARTAYDTCVDVSNRLNGRPTSYVFAHFVEYSFLMQRLIDAIDEKY